MTPGQRVGAVTVAVAAIAAPFVAHFEGEVRHGYRDPIGIVTSCFGHTGPEAQMGRTYTHAECLAQLTADLDHHDAGLLACVRVPMADNVHAAMLSFAFNVGVRAACGSTAIAKINAGDIMAACAELSKWVRAGGKVLPGLVRRRAAERALCEGRPIALGAIG
ncbi:MAG: hypothetical protein RL682_179 [Pseudomonadota bacterium]|jgi:lysozyme